MFVRKGTLVGLALLLAAGSGFGAASKAAKSVGTRASALAASGKAARAKKSSKRSRRRQPGQKAPAADRITEIQQALAKDGSFSGNPNGKWDDATGEAMRKFQAAHGLNPTGKLDALTLQKLGLGSKTAGVAAPLPVSTSLNNTSVATPVSPATAATTAPQQP
jgi:peptidoglycan hydrolase-like protein with peptidoglycan-binding domain